MIKLTLPVCAYQIEAEVGCLTAIEGKLSVATPRLRAHGELAGWPYVVMERLPGIALADIWPQLEPAHRYRLAQDLGRLCRELHSLPPQGFPGEWPRFWKDVSSNVGARHMAQGCPPQLHESIETFLQKVGLLSDSPTVPLHTGAD